MDESKATDESKQFNWVERRYNGQQLLHTEAPEIWHRIRGAIQDACESFNRLYAPKKVFCELTNGHRLRIHRTLQPLSSRESPKEFEVLVTFSEHTIAITREAGARMFYIRTDDETVFIVADLKPETRRLTPDEVSQEALEAFLFQKP